jgi:hypothetical protein
MEFTKSVSETSEFTKSPSTDSTSDTSTPPSESHSALEEVSRSGKSDGMQADACDGNGADGGVDGDESDGEEDSGSVYRPNAEDDEVTARLGPAAPRFYDWKELFGFLKVFKENHDVLVKEMQSYSRAWADWPETNLYSVSVGGCIACISIVQAIRVLRCVRRLQDRRFPSRPPFYSCVAARICQTLHLLSVCRTCVLSNPFYCCGVVILTFDCEFEHLNLKCI